MNQYDFEQNGGIENWNGNLKKKNCNKPRKISDFEQNNGIEQRNEKPKKTNYNKLRKFWFWAKYRNWATKRKTLKDKLQQTEKYLLVL